MHNPVTITAGQHTEQISKFEEQQDSGYLSVQVLTDIECDGHLPSLHITPQNVTKEAEPMDAIEDALSNMKLDSLTQQDIPDCGLNVCSISVCEQPDDIDLRQMCPYVHSNNDKPEQHQSYCETSLRQRICEDRSYKMRTGECIVRIFQENEDGDNHLHLSIIDDRESDSMAIIDHVPEYDWLSFANLLGQTPLHLAVLKRQPTVVRRLVCAGAFVTTQDHCGNTPLHLACRDGYEEIVRPLLTPVIYEETVRNSGAIPFQRLPQDMSVRNSEGHTCLHLAAKAGHYHVVQMLLDAGANVNLGEGKSGRTLLHMAAETNDLDMVKLLLSRPGIDCLCTTYDDLTPAHLAFGRSHMCIVHMIQQHAEKFHSMTWRDFSHLEISDEEDDSDEDNMCVSRVGEQWSYNCNDSS